MSRLPLQFAGKDISFRIPYSMAAELAVPPSTFGTVFPEASFLNSIDKPLEVHRVFINLAAQGQPTGYSFLTILDPQPTTLDQRIRISITDFSKNEKFMKAPTIVAALLNQLTGAWELEEPYTIVRSEGFQVQIDTLDFPGVIIINSLLLPEYVTVPFVRVVLNFQGYLDIIAPPSETR